MQWLIIVMHSITIICLLLIESLKSCFLAFWRLNCFISVASLRLPVIPLNLIVSKVFFIADKQARQILMLVTSIMCLKSPSSPPHFAVCSSTRSLPWQQRWPVATEQQQHSSLNSGSELTAKKGSLLLWMSKICFLTQTDLKLNPDQFKINEYNHVTYVNSFIGIQPCFHNILHSTEFIDEFIIWIHIWFHNMNSYMIS